MVFTSTTKLSELMLFLARFLHRVCCTALTACRTSGRTAVTTNVVARSRLTWRFLQRSNRILLSPRQDLRLAMKRSRTSQLAWRRSRRCSQTYVSLPLLPAMTVLLLSFSLSVVVDAPHECSGCKAGSYSTTS
jgi:hypothetical protein